MFKIAIVHHPAVNSRYRAGLRKVKKSRSTLCIDEHEVGTMVDVSRRFRVRELPNVHCSRVFGHEGLSGCRGTYAANHIQIRTAEVKKFVFKYTEKSAKSV